MTKTEFLLIQLEGFFYTTYPKYFEFLNESNVDLKIESKDNSLILLYNWHDGTDVGAIDKIGKMQFCSFGYFIPYAEATVYKKFFIENDCFKNSKNFFPIIASQTGDFLLIDITKRKSKVYLYSPHLLLNSPEVIFDNVECFIETVYACYIKKAYYFDEAYNLMVNYDIEKQVAQKLNQNSPFWKQ